MIAKENITMFLIMSFFFEKKIIGLSLQVDDNCFVLFERYLTFILHLCISLYGWYQTACFVGSGQQFPLKLMFKSQYQIRYSFHVFLKEILLSQKFRLPIHLLVFMHSVSLYVQNLTLPKKITNICCILLKKKKKFESVECEGG